MSAKLYRVILPVYDINQAQSFYARLLGMEGARVSAGRHYFDCGGTILACFDARADGDDFDVTPNPEHVYIAVPDLETIFQKARTAGCAQIDETIKMQPWGERCFYIKDPFGNPVCFVDERTMFTG